MGRKGFTLIELLCIIIILSLLLMLVIPTILGVVKSYGKETDKVVLTMIEDATKLYIDDYNNLFNKEDGNNYCISIKELVEKKYLKDYIEYNGEDITQLKSIKATYNDGFNFELVDSDACVSNQIICTPATEETKTLGNIPLGEFNPGDEYVCTVGKEESYNFFVLNNNDGMITLLSSWNIGNTVNWASDINNNYGPIASLNYLNELTFNWEIIPITNYIYKNNNGYKKLQIDNGITKIADINNEKKVINGISKARLVTLDELLLSASKVNRNLTQENLNKYAIDNLSGLNEYYGVSATTAQELLEATNSKTHKDLWLLISKYIKEKNIEYDITLPNWMYINLEFEGGPIGYWTFSTDSNKASFIDNSGIPNFGDVNVNNRYGIRPVIELSKYQLGINVVEEQIEDDEISSEYTRLEYIESTGTQYIITDYINVSDNKPSMIESHFQITDTTVTGFLFGTSKSTGNNYPLWFGIEYKDTNKLYMFGHYGSTGSSVRFGTLDAHKHKVEYIFGEGVYLDNLLINETITQATTSSISGTYIGIFAPVKDTTVDTNRIIKAKLYGMQFFEDDIIVRNFIPAKRKSDNEIGLYDIVTGTFYTNSGTGEFIGA